MGVDRVEGLGLKIGVNDVPEEGEDRGPLQDANIK